MEWLFIAAASAGIPMIVPPLLAAFDADPSVVDVKLAARAPASREGSGANDDAVDAGENDPSEHDAAGALFTPPQRVAPPLLVLGVIFVVTSVAGLVCVWVDASSAVTVGASLALGLAAGVMAPELLTWLERHERQPGEPIPD